MPLAVLLFKTTLASPLTVKVAWLAVVLPSGRVAT